MEALATALVAGGLLILFVLFLRGGR